MAGTYFNILEYLFKLFVAYKRAVRLAKIKTDFGTRVHAEPSRSKAAEDYVWKLDTRIPNTQFQLGSRAIKRNDKTDWALVKQQAQTGNLNDIDPSVFVAHYRSLKQISIDYGSMPIDLSSCCGIWIFGPPGVGKSHFAREHYPKAYMKMQNKWWDGYQNEENVILDDLDSKILGHHLKIWSDKYSFVAEMKGSSKMIRPKNFIVTSNYTIETLFADDVMLVDAIKRRFYVICIPNKRFI